MGFSKHAYITTGLCSAGLTGFFLNHARGDVEMASTISIGFFAATIGVLGIASLLQISDWVTLQKFKIADKTRDAVKPYLYGAGACAIITGLIV